MISIKKKIIAVLCLVLINMSGCSEAASFEVNTDIADKSHLIQNNTESETFETPNIDTEKDIMVDENSEVSEINKESDMSEDAFYQSELSREIKEKITGCTFPDTDEQIEISYDDLAYLHVLHYNFNDEICEGEIICNKKIAQDLLEIFEELYNNKYQIEKIRLIDEYNANDLASMADNNSSAFNYRVISGTSKLSNHSYGMAIDINPLYNPYVFHRNGEDQVQPFNAYDYVDRDQDFEHKIDHEDLCYKAFIKHGFTWGGDWNSSKDYQHFEKLLD